MPEAAVVGVVVRGATGVGTGAAHAWVVWLGGISKTHLVWVQQPVAYISYIPRKSYPMEFDNDIPQLAMDS